MRQLTPIDPTEKLIAEGRYICYRSMPYEDRDTEIQDMIDQMIEDARRRVEPEGLTVLYEYDETNPRRIVHWLVPSGVFESWSWHQLPNGFRRLRVDRDGERGDGYTMLAEMLFKPQDQGGQIHSAQAKVDYWAGGVGEIHGTASYTFLEDCVITSRDVNRRNIFKGIQSWSIQDEIQAIPMGYLVSTGTMIGDGKVIDQMTKAVPKPEITKWPQENAWVGLDESAIQPVFVLLRHEGTFTEGYGSYLLYGEREFWQARPICRVQYGVSGQLLDGYKHVLMQMGEGLGGVGRVFSVSNSGIALEAPNGYWYKLMDYLCG